ncbi:hypothetical protein HPP92_010820 [Vanilla planifolia]|uniref:Uncharacterized protein n=1 Tax=Vanilla planifolia TaxID=51239 RepID=A0A835UZM4_VANPL|nr:hypothetical protein HPP92_010820 [Vanilla planifolia]
MHVMAVLVHVWHEGAGVGPRCGDHLHCGRRPPEESNSAAAGYLSWHRSVCRIGDGVCPRIGLEWARVRGLAAEQSSGV